MNTKPNVYLIGGPKCGTTAMVAYLKEHKNIFISEPKESNYFMDDFPKMKFTDNLETYNNLFSYATKDEYIKIDASILYAFSEIAIENIYKYNKNAKIIMMIRNPIEMVPSWHKQIMHTLDETEKDFTKVLNLEDNRKNGESIPKSCRDKKLLNYSEIAKYYKQLTRVYKYFPKESVKVILFDEFKQDNLNSYKEILSFLNVDYDGRVNFPKVNEAKTARSSLINLIVNKQPKILMYLVRVLRKVLNKPRLGILQKIDHLNRKNEKVSPLTPEAKKQLRILYQKDVSQLSVLLDKNLDHWL